jgi:predicted  nucleic acid-binding Zn-ribbon protein
LNSDLQHLIHLQELDLSAERLRRRIADIPGAQDALDTRVAAAAAAASTLREQISANQAARRDIEKDLATVQARLSKYKDQLMEVKTNKEYQAMQHEIAAAEQNVRAQEDRLLERMVEADTLAAELKRADAALKVEQAEVARLRSELDLERREVEGHLNQAIAERARVAGQLTAPTLALFDHVARHRRGIALSEARDGHCTQCHVRLRPQVFNDVRRNDGLIQCESCSRILYFVPAAAGTAPQSS